jgi:hypothetical protein
MLWRSCAKRVLLECTFRTSLLGPIAIPVNLVCTGLFHLAITTANGVNKQGHILRLLATYHIGKEVSPNTFANNRLSSFIDSGKDFEAIKAK